MDLIYDTSTAIETVEEYVKGSQGRFRRRAVLTQGQDGWELLCGVVQGFQSGKQIITPMSTRVYQDVILHEDWLETTQCWAFVEELKNGHVQFGEVSVKPASNMHWQVEFVSVGNSSMPQAGRLVSAQVNSQRTNSSLKTLLAPGHPYYPGVEEAARDWLPFSTYHGHSDARNGELLFLLPETRAYLASASFVESGKLFIKIEGTEIDTLCLTIKGAYWLDGKLHHIESAVLNGVAEIVIPDDFDQFEYCLVDQNSTLYDFHRENKYYQVNENGSSQQKDALTLEQHVIQSCQAGEGLHIEFKPFVDPQEPLFKDEEKAKRSKTKLREVIETVVAFSNTGGGRIYLGVNDDCTISGIGKRLREWGKGQINEDVINRYFGALKAKIKDNLSGEVLLKLAHTEVDGRLIAVVEVTPSIHGPVAFHQEYHAYVRSGASNRKAPPDQWEKIVNRPRNLDMPEVDGWTGLSGS